MSGTNRFVDIPVSDRDNGSVGYRAPKVCDLVDITYRQLDYWTTQGLARASVRDADGPGSQRLYSFDDIVTLRVIKRLLDTGVSLEKVRAAIVHLRGRGLELRHVTLVSDGTTVSALDDDRHVVDLLQQCQGVFAIALDPIITQLEGEVAALEPERGDPPVTRPAARLADGAKAG